MHDAGVLRLRGRWLGRVSRRAGEGGVRELGVLWGGLSDVSSGEYMGLQWCVQAYFPYRGSRRVLQVGAALAFDEG